MNHRVVSEYKRDEEHNSSNIKVFVRARPMEEDVEQSDFIQIDADDERKISIRNPEATSKSHGEVSFSFDRVFWTETAQEKVFNTVCKQQVDHVLNGYNCCCFACKSLGVMMCTVIMTLLMDDTPRRIYRAFALTSLYHFIPRTL